MSSRIRAEQVRGRLRRGLVRRTKVAAVTTALFAVTVVGQPTAHAEDTGQPDVVGYNCHEFIAFPGVPHEAAAKLVPEDSGFTVARAPERPNTVTLFITSRRCERLYLLGKTAFDVIESYIAVPVQPPSFAPRESSFGPSAGDNSVELIGLENYLVQWVTNSQLRATWLRQGTGLGDDRVQVIEDLVFDYDPMPGFVPGAVDGAFRVEVPPPAPSPYTIGAQVTEPGGVSWFARQNQWWATDAATTVIFADTDSAFFGTGNGTITSDDPNSPLGQAFGEKQERDTSTDPSFIPFSFGFYTEGTWTKVVVDRGGCTQPERQAFLGAEQRQVLALVKARGLTTLRDETDIARLAAPDPDSGTAYNFYDHQFVSARDMGVAVVNTGEVGPGKPDLLLYVPNPEAADVIDPYGPDFPYTLAGWAYSATYAPNEPPTFLEPCIAPFEWFVHERSIHPAHDWTNVAVPPDEQTHGEASGTDPPLPTECDPLCPVGFSHRRLWDIHLWLGENRIAEVSMLSPTPIPGFDPEVGVGFFFPDD